MSACTKGVLFISGESCFAAVARVPLWQRALLNGRKAGIEDWLILAWHNASQLQTDLLTEPRLKEVNGHVIDMTYTPLPHVQDALPHEDVLGISASTVFDHRILLALQDHIAPVQAPAEAAGLFRCSGTDLQHAIQQTWSEFASAPDPFPLIITHLNQLTTMSALDITPYAWTPITHPIAPSIAQAEAQLLQHLGRDGDSLVIRLVARRVSRALTRRLLPTQVRPNHITLASGLIGISGGLLLAQPGMWWQFLGSLLFLFSTIIDGCDGELARLTFQESRFGAKLDVTMDNVVHGVLFPAIAIGQYRQNADPMFLILGALTLGGVIVSMLVFLPYVLRPNPTRNRQARLHESLASRDFAYLLPLLAMTQKLHWFLWATAIGTYVFAAAWIVISRRQTPNA